MSNIISPKGTPVEPKINYEYVTPAYERPDGVEYETPRGLPRSNLFSTVAAYPKKILFEYAERKEYRRVKIQEHGKSRNKEKRTYCYYQWKIYTKGKGSFLERDKLYFTKQQGDIQREVNSIEEELGISIIKQKIKFII